MGRRLEKYYLFCYTTFLSLFTMKFVRYVYRKFPIYIGSFLYIYTTKHTLSWSKKRLQNKSEISDLFCWLVCFNFTVNLSRGITKNRFFSKRRRAHAVWKNTVYFVTHHDKYAVSWNKKICELSWKFTIGFFVPTYTVFVVKCYKINSIFPNGVCATPFGKKSIFCNILRQLHSKLKQKKNNKISRKFPTYFVSFFCSNLECVLSYINIGNFRYISKISDLFRRRFLFQLKSAFCRIYIGNFRYISEIYDIFCRLFCSNLECILSYIYIYRTNFIVNKLKKAMLQNK